MKYPISLSVALLLAVRSACAFSAHPTIAKPVPSRRLWSRNNKSTRLHYSCDTIEQQDHVTTHNKDAILHSVKHGFHNDDFTSEEMVWELAPLLPPEARLDIRCIGRIGRVEVHFPRVNGAKPERLAFSTFLDRSNVDAMKVLIQRHYDEDHYNGY